MYKLYTAPTPNGWKVAMALEELRAQYEVQLIDLQSGEQHSNWFLQINPNGRIPVLKTMGKDSNIIFDSNAILIYLAEKFGDRKAISFGIVLYTVGLLISSNAVTPEAHQFLNLIIGCGIAGTGFGPILAVVGR